MLVSRKRLVVGRLKRCARVLRVLGVSRENPKSMPLLRGRLYTAVWLNSLDRSGCANNVFKDIDRREDGRSAGRTSSRDGQERACAGGEGKLNQERRSAACAAAFAAAAAAAAVCPRTVHRAVFCRPVGAPCRLPRAVPVLLLCLSRDPPGAGPGVCGPRRRHPTLPTEPLHADSASGRSPRLAAEARPDPGRPPRRRTSHGHAGGWRPRGHTRKIHAVGVLSL